MDENAMVIKPVERLSRLVSKIEGKFTWSQDDKEELEEVRKFKGFAGWYKRRG